MPGRLAQQALHASQGGLSQGLSSYRCRGAIKDGQPRLHRMLSVSGRGLGLPRRARAVREGLRRLGKEG